MWIARSADGGAWVEQQKLADTEIIAETGLFADAIQRTDARRVVLPVDVVIGVENTRATSLSWPDDVREEFTEELRHHLRSRTEVHLTQHATLTMARVGRRRGPVMKATTSAS